MEHNNNLMYHPGDPSYPPPEGPPIYAPPPHYAYHAQEDAAHPPPYYHPPQHHGHGHQHSYPLPPPPHPYYPPPPRYGHPGHHHPPNPPPNNVTHHHHHQQETSYHHHPYQRPPPLPHPPCQYEYGGAPISSNSNDHHPHPHAVVITPTEEIPPHPSRYSIHPKEEQQSISSSSTAPSSSSTLYTTTTNNTKLLSTTTTTTTTRRKKKMYSDFVGVTYNKTHAKFQACITHYRKQHYLGRYKLAVDAALAYDESARLLKGNSWKVNFASQNEYEVAKVKEIHRVNTTIRGGAAPTAGAGAASCGVNVASRRVGEMATQDQVLAIARVRTNNVGLGAMNTSIKAESRTEQLLPPAANCGDGAYQEERISCSPPKRRLDDIGENDERTRVVVQKLSSPSGDAGLIQSPCPSFQPPLTSTHKSLYTPLHDVASPNPACHAMGTSITEKGTPDSLIHPTALTYNNSSDMKSSSQQQHGDEKKFSNNYPVGKQEYECQQSNQQPRSSRSKSKSTATDDGPNSVPPPSVIQNGTLAAASALMTLFGKEKET